MKTLHYRLVFQTPAFLGNASQEAQWRTPPFKALLRQWWRVGYSLDHDFQVDVSAMRREEAKLFGHAWLEDDHTKAGKTAARKSRVRIRLNSWALGKQWAEKEDPKVKHYSVQQRIGSQLYLGYGPLQTPKQAKRTMMAIPADNAAILTLAVHDSDETSLGRALYFTDRFGTVGGRSRNGWGSFRLIPQEGTPALVGSIPQRPWKDALTLDWAHAVGCDERGALIWQTQSFNTWQGAIKALAEIKISIWRQFRPNTGEKAQNPESRHWLNYPVTHHSVRDWGADKRIPNSLRFKIRPAPNDSGKLVGEIFHMPCQPPVEFKPDPANLQQIWAQAHALLDQYQATPLHRISI